jgi:DNA repair and recombination RAD54-like protein
MAAVPAVMSLLQRAIIVCPTSLVSNWDSECTKWLKGRCRYATACHAEAVG